MTPYDAICATNDQYRAASSRAYHADEEIHLNKSRLSYRVKEANPGRWSLRQFDRVALLSPAARFTLVTTLERCEAPRWHDTHVLRVDTLAGDDERVAKMVDDCSTDGWTIGKLILPLSGAMVDRHAVLGRLAAIARGMIARSLPDFHIDFAAWMDALDGSRAGHADCWTHVSIAEADFDAGARDRAAAAHPELVERLRRHDWSHDYADRTIRSAVDEEKALIALTSELDLDEAALLMIAADAPLGYARSMLGRHPALKAPMKKAA